MSASFRPVEDIALRNVRIDQLPHQNWSAYQRWINLVKGRITREIKMGEQRVEWYNRHYPSKK